MSNLESTPGYGEDEYCREAADLILKECDCEEGEVLREAFLSKGLRPFSESYTNQQIFYLPNSAIESLSSHASFEVWGAPGKEETAVRFVTSWATSDEEVAALLKLIEA